MKLPEFQQTFVIKYDASTKDSIYGRSNDGAPVWTTLATVVGMIYPIRMESRVKAGLAGLYSTHRAICDYDDLLPIATAAVGKRLQIEYAGRKYTVEDYTEQDGKFVHFALNETEAA